MKIETKKQILGRDLSTGLSIAITISDGVVSSIDFINHDEQSWICPGLVDLQVNGYRGYDFNSQSLDVSTIQSISRELLCVGVTSYFPTIITTSESRIIRALRMIHETCEMDQEVKKMIAGVHVEGPHIDQSDGPRGAHSLEYIRAPSINEFNKWQIASRGLLKLVTLSPHWPETVTYIHHLVQAGIRVSIGHTSANAKQILSAIEAGASLSTHLGNGSHVLLNRRENHLWPQLADDRLTAMFIADGHHLDPLQLKVMIRAKSLENSVIVSDSVALAGMKPGKYHSPVGGRVELRSDGLLCIDDGSGSYLAGAALPLLAAIPVLVNHVGISLSAAIKLMTNNPGKLAGSGRGEIGIGKPADILAIKWNQYLSQPVVSGVWLRGKHMVKNGRYIGA